MALPEFNNINRFFTFSADPSAIIRDDGRLKKINTSFCKTFPNNGIKPLGLPLYDFFPGEYKNDFKIQLKKARHEKKSFTFDTQYIDQANEFRWIQWNIIPHKWKNLFYAAGRDITLLKEQEEQLRVSYTAMEAAANGIYLMNKNKVVTWVNSSFLKISGFTRKEIEGRTPKILSSGVHSENFFASIIDTLNSGMVWTGEVVNRKPEGTLYTVEQTIAPVYNPQGELSYFVAIMQDISDRKKTEKMIQEHIALLHRDIDLAGKVQTSLLPTVLPELDGFDISALAIPARYVSGDLYDCFLQPDNKCFFAMADISGKGVPAAMLASSIKTLIQSGVTPAETPASFLHEINHRLYNQLSQAEKFVTFFTAVFNPDTSELIYSSAGHTQAILLRFYENSIELLSPTGIPLGVLDEVEYSETSAYLAPGDTFILYSDGITEAHNEQWELFGMDRLIETITTSSFPNAEERLQSIIKAVSDFRKETPLSDDISLITFIAKPRTLQYSFEAKLENLEAMNTIVRNGCSAYGQEFSYAMELSASELFTNVIMHSHKNFNGWVSLKLSLNTDKAELDLYDTAPVFTSDLQPAKAEDLLKEGGHGLRIIQNLSDEFTHTAVEPQGNHWHIVKRR